MKGRTLLLLYIVLLNLNVLVLTYSRKASKRGGFEQCRLRTAKKGIEWLLDNRNAEWGWGTRQEAEAIIAFHLADEKWFNRMDPESYISVKQMNIDLLVQLSHDNALNNELWSHGKLAHYILGLKATCQDPRNFYGHDLIEKLEAHLDNSADYFKSNRFALSLAVLAICNSDEVVKDKYLNVLMQNSGNYTFGVEEASMVLMALSCVNKSITTSSKQIAESYILNKQNSSDGSFGDKYKTGLAVQALIASGRQDVEQNIKHGIKALIEMQESGNGIFNNVASVNQILPALLRKSFLDIGKTPCIVPTTVSPPTAVPSETITITVVDTLFNNFNQTWIVVVPKNITLYDAMVHLQNQNIGFTFTSVLHSFGRFINSINGMSTSSEDRTYWSLLIAPNTPSPNGVSNVIVKNGDHYIFKMATF